MPKKPSRQERAFDFRYALANEDFDKAASLLQEHPFVIDHPVYGDSESALHYFATGNRADTVTWLVQNGADPDGIATDENAVHAAAQLGHLKVVRALIDSGAHLNPDDDSGETPLHKASAAGHLDVLRLLLEAGADPSAGEHPADLAPPEKAEQTGALFRHY